MDDKLSRIQKPLAIIAIFAGAVQISGIAVLPHIDSAYQSKLIWFLISFPVLMVLLFFITINYFIRAASKSNNIWKFQNSGKTFKPVTRYEVEQRKKDDSNVRTRRKTVFENEPYSKNTHTKSEVRDEAELTGEKYRRITRASEERINWK